ncbi:MAG: hypothetical protein U0V18_03060 [Anaerolineales bacterium]
MNIEDLKVRLEEEACSRANYSIGERDSDVFCLENQNGIWRIFYTERGIDQPPIFESPSESEACEYFFTFMTTKIQHNHIVGYFISREKAEALVETLAQHNIPTYRNDIPYHGWHDPRFRVFVIGKDVFKAREILGELPVRDIRD